MTKVKRTAVKLLNVMKLDRIVTEVKRAKTSFLHVFFAAKTHKPDIPFRSIVTERGTWQHAVSGYLQRHLATLNVDDPFRVPNSSALVELLQQKTPVNVRLLMLT